MFILVFIPVVELYHIACYEFMAAGGCPVDRRQGNAVGVAEEKILEFGGNHGAHGVLPPVARAE